MAGKSPLKPITTLTQLEEQVEAFRVRAIEARRALDDLTGDIHPHRRENGLTSRIKTAQDRLHAAEQGYANAKRLLSVDKREENESMTTKKSPFDDLGWRMNFPPPRPQDRFIGLDCNCRTDRDCDILAGEVREIMDERRRRRAEMEEMYGPDPPNGRDESRS